jgi:hypothetical protein
MVDRLFAGSEVACRSTPDLDDHQVSRRTRVDRHEIELMATDMDVPGEDRPTLGSEPVRHESFGGIADELCRGPVAIRGMGVHTRMVPGGPSLAVNPGSSADYVGGRRGVGGAPPLRGCTRSVHYVEGPGQQVRRATYRSSRVQALHRLPRDKTTVERSGGADP